MDFVRRPFPFRLYSPRLDSKKLPTTDPYESFNPPVARRVHPDRTELLTIIKSAMQTGRLRSQMLRVVHRWRPAISAFTLIELLVVIALVAILAAFLLPELVKSGPSPFRRAKMEINMILSATTAYQATYGRFPVSSNTLQLATVTKSDFTFGGSPFRSTLGSGPWIADNSETMAILLDLETFGNGTSTINKAHAMNPQNIRFLNAHLAGNTVSPGLGTDRVYRDPWGNPYIISLDLNGDNKCRDALYSRRAVSQQSGPTGFDGLTNSRDSDGSGDNFEFSGGVMVWALGPDKSASANQSANAGSNKDNVLSWRH